MPKKYRPILIRSTDATQEEQVQREIDRFLLALNSYPECFAHDPSLTFDQYLCYLMASDPLNGGPSRVH
jgi:hypothetical protein